MSPTINEYKQNFIIQNPSARMLNLENMLTSGEISVIPASSAVPYNAWLYLIIGPTGAGKSSFIEAFASESQNLKISKNQLASYTQQVNAYQLANITLDNQPIYLIDTPGFSDVKIADIEIMSMVQAWLEENKVRFVHKILFLMPINDIRFTATRRRTVEMFGQFLRGSGDFYATIFVTTMWDILCTQQARQRAELNFIQLRDEILEEFITNNAQITSFMNTRSSALDILDKTTLYSEAFCELPTSAMELLERELYDRIESTLLKRGSLETELANFDTKRDLELTSILTRAQKENQDVLIKFIGQYSALRRLDYRVSDEGYERWLSVHNTIQRLPLVIQKAIDNVPNLYPNEALWETIGPAPAKTPQKQLKKLRPLSWTSRIDQRMQSFQLPHRARSASVRSPSEQISAAQPISIKVLTSVTYTD